MNKERSRRPGTRCCGFFAVIVAVFVAVFVLWPMPVLESVLWPPVLVRVLESVLSRCRGQCWCGSRCGDRDVFDRVKPANLQHFSSFHGL
ncbi:hypothetical protein ABEX25_24580 [Paenibacillus thiaminolyticus]|uniref:hypothetical protein n=1 Tax=Paenibacillus thiaminolyticus TaxID=49283 RepID=UPI003D27FEAB